MSNPVKRSTFLILLAQIFISPLYGEHDNGQRHFFRDEQDLQHRNMIEKRSYSLVSINKDQEKKVQECKEELATKNTEIIGLKLKVTQLEEMVQTCPSSSVPGDGSTLISASQESKNQNTLIINNFKGTPYASTVVCFVAQKSSPFNRAQAMIQFEEVVLNLGKSFYSDENVFIAPKAGIYEFTFNGHKSGKDESVLKVSLRLNGKDVLNAWSDEMGNHIGYGIHKNRNMISMHSLLKLKIGDRIDMFQKQGTLCEDDAHHQIHFTGKLLFDDDDATLTLNGHPKVAAASPVYFVLQKNKGFSGTSVSVIPFEIKSLNVGGAFDMKNQIFIAPLTGIYEFTLKGYKSGEQHDLKAHLSLNGKAVTNSLADWAGNHGFHTPFSIHSILKARKEDRIELYLLRGKLVDDSNRYTIYTGKLLMEQPDTQTDYLAVYFNVQKNASFSIADEIVPFEKEILNVGGAFNIKENTFTAPKGGIYEFNFKGSKNGIFTYAYLAIALRLNGDPVAYAWAESVKNHNFFTPFFLHSVLKMKKGDQIDLFMKEGVLFDDQNQNTHFTGKLVFEENVNA